MDNKEPGGYTVGLFTFNGFIIEPYELRRFIGGHLLQKVPGETLAGLLSR
jgi:hypothetical protein